MDWNNIQYFNKEEFHGNDELLDIFTIFNLDAARHILQEKIYPSPAKGAIARFGGSILSQHYVGDDPNNIIRKSKAIDVFVEGVPFLNLSTLMHSSLFSGIGVYLDTNGPDGKPWVMFHLDNRESYTCANPLVWIAVKTIDPKTEEVTTVYRYPQNDSQVWSLLKKDIFYRERELIG